jgi:hypothetical protein
VVVCWNCDEQFIRESELRARLDDLRLYDDTVDPHDEGYMAALYDIRRHFLGDES